MTVEEMKNRLSAFDGNAVTLLSEVRATERNQPDFIDDLLFCCFDDVPNISMGATWILKAELTDGLVLSDRQRNALIDKLSNRLPWQSCLHISQSVDFLDVNEKQAVDLFSWAKGFNTHSRPFVRAWCLHVQVSLAARYPVFQTDANITLERASRDPAASVRARARNLQNMTRPKSCAKGQGRQSR
jgi:hypothetical protein